MNEQAERLLRELAQKLGTTVEHLWAVLVKQAPISAYTDLFFILCFLALTITFYRCLRRVCIQLSAIPESEYESGDWGLWYFPNPGDDDAWQRKKAEREIKDKERADRNALHASNQAKRSALDGPFHLYFIAMCIALTTLVFMALGWSTEITSGLFNPEYWALKQIIK